MDAIGVSDGFRARGASGNEWGNSGGDDATGDDGTIGILSTCCDTWRPGRCGRGILELTGVVGGVGLTRRSAAVPSVGCTKRGTGFLGMRRIIRIRIGGVGGGEVESGSKSRLRQSWKSVGRSVEIGAVGGTSSATVRRGVVGWLERSILERWRRCRHVDRVFCCTLGSCVVDRAGCESGATWMELDSSTVSILERRCCCGVEGRRDKAAAETFQTGTRGSHSCPVGGRGSRITLSRSRHRCCMEMRSAISSLGGDQKWRSQEEGGSSNPGGVTGRADGCRLGPT